MWYIKSFCYFRSKYNLRNNRSTLTLVQSILMRLRITVDPRKHTRAELQVSQCRKLIACSRGVKRQLDKERNCMCRKWLIEILRAVGAARVIDSSLMTGQQRSSPDRVCRAAHIDNDFYDHDSPAHDLNTHWPILINNNNTSRYWRRGIDVTKLTTWLIWWHQSGLILRSIYANQCFSKNVIFTLL